MRNISQSVYAGIVVSITAVAVIVIQPHCFGLERASLKLREASFAVEGSSCVDCIREIERHLRCSHGVIDADITVRYPIRAHVIYNPRQISLLQILDKVRQQKARVDDLKDNPYKDKDKDKDKGN